MLKVTKCIGVKFFVEALNNMVYELKITSGCKKKMCKNFMVIRYSIKELLAKSMVTRPMKCIEVSIKLLNTIRYNFEHPNIYYTEYRTIKSPRYMKIMSNILQN